jgi:SAM-dependent methyltransferase
VTFLAQDAESFCEGRYDLITSFETLEHLRRRSSLLLNLSRMLKPSGTLVVSTPNKAVTSPLRPANRPTNPWHVFEYTQRGFLRELRRARFELRELHGQIFLPWCFRLEPYTALAWFLYRKLGLFKGLYPQPAVVRPLSVGTAAILVAVASPSSLRPNR